MKNKSTKIVVFSLALLLCACLVGNLSAIAKAQENNSPPNTPSTISGPSSGYTGISYTFSTSATDPDGDQVKYVFDWGDGSTSETGFVNSGTTASESHSWSDSGEYTVMVKAIDEHGASSPFWIIFIGGITITSPTPTPPHAFYGTVEINGEPAPTDTRVEARGEGVRTGYSGNPIITTEVGKYGSEDILGQKLLVQGDIAEGTTITFYVNGVSTGQTAEYRAGAMTRLPLSVTIAPAPPPAPAPATTPLSVTFNGWYVDGVKVTTATTDDTVTARIILSGGKSGQYEMRIKRDIVWASDEVIKRRPFYYDGGSATEELSFNPPYAMGEASTDGYFVALAKDGTQIWDQVNAYPPRLRVTLPPPNKPPTAHIDSISPHSAKQEEPVSFSGHGVDTDGSVVGFSWRSSIDGQLNNSSSFSMPRLSVGMHTIYFKVRDNKGLWSPEVSRTLTIKPPNRPPTAYIDSISPGQIKVGETVSFSGHSTDPDGSVTGYSWRSSIDGQLSTSSSFSTSSLSEGTHTICFKVMDNNEVWSEEVSGTITIEPNKPPIAYIDSISPSRVKVTNEVSFKGHGTDADGSVVSYSWRSSVDGQVSTSSSFITSNLSEGTHTIYFKVRDDNGAWSEEVSGTVIIEPNRPPVAYIDSITPSRVEQNKNVSFTGRGEDLDGSVVGYSWRSSIDGELSTSLSFATATLSVGKHTIYFKVKDNDGLWSEEVSSTLLVDRPGPYVELYGQRTDVEVGEEIILNLSVINPITSLGTLVVQLTLSIPSGWSITSSGFGHGAGGLRTNTYEVEQGPNPRTISVHILANEPYDGVVSGYLDYYFIGEKEDSYHQEVALPVTAAIPEAPAKETPQPKKGGDFFSCSAPAQGASPPSSGELLLGWAPLALCWGGLGGLYGVLRWRRRNQPNNQHD